MRASSAHIAPAWIRSKSDAIYMETVRSSVNKTHYSKFDQEPCFQAAICQKLLMWGCKVRRVFVGMYVVGDCTRFCFPTGTGSKQLFDLHREVGSSVLE